MINHFHNKGFALRLVFGTWKWLIRNWPITMTCYDLECLGGLFSDGQFLNLEQKYPFMKLQILVTRSLKNSRKLDLTPGKVIILHKNKNKQSKPVNERLGRGESRSASPRARP